MTNNATTPQAEWKRFARFPDIYLVIGSPLDIADLHAAGANSASRAVLFANNGRKSKNMAGGGAAGSADQAESTNKFSRQMRDSRTILAYRALKVVNPRINVTVELISSENLRLLDESEMGSGMNLSGADTGEGVGGGGSQTAGQDMPVSESWLSPSFASGHAFLSTVVDTIFAQSYYNRHLIGIIQELVIGTPDVITDAWHKVLGSEVGHVNNSHLHLVVVPAEYHNRTYAYTLYSLMKRGVLAMGLRRGVKGEAFSKVAHMGVGSSNSQPYVYTNPSNNTLIHGTDLLYVLCHGSPHELGLNIALFDYGVTQHESKLTLSVLSKMKSIAGKVDQRRRSSVRMGNTKDEQRVEEEGVSAPASMRTGKKDKRRFTVVKHDKTVMDPYAKLSAELKKNDSTKDMLRRELSTLHESMQKEVSNLRESVETQMSEMGNKMNRVEKYMWRQNVIHNLRDAQARKRRQQQARSPSPQRKGRGSPAGFRPVHSPAGSELSFGGLTTNELRKMEEAQTTELERLKAAEQSASVSPGPDR